MITLEIPTTKRTLYLPEDLAECDERQYAEACLLIYKYQNKKITPDDFKVEMIYKLLNLKKGNRKINDDDLENMYSGIDCLTGFIDSFFEIIETDGKEDLVIKQYYIHNHTPVIKDGFKTWYGPADEFNDVTFGQYIDALNVYSMIEVECTEELLFRLMAIFYLPKGKTYTPELAEKNFHHFKAVYFGRVYGFFLLFASFQKYLFTAKVFVHGNELDLSILFSGKDGKKEDSNIPGIGMLGVAHQLAESGVYGPMKELRITNLWEVMIHLYDLRKRDLDDDAKKKKETPAPKK